MAIKDNHYIEVYNKDGESAVMGKPGQDTVSVTGLKDGTTVSAGDYTVALKDVDAQKDVKRYGVPAVKVGKPVVHVKSVSLDKEKLSVEKGASAKLTATVAPGNASNKAVDWKSSNDAIATVDQNGKVTGVKAGDVHVVVTTKDGSKTATCDVTVTAKSSGDASKENE